tara:strand:- start:250 stop:456 length:207 start_codon:yes stop_codon:yes gene_type:complete
MSKISSAEKASSAKAEEALIVLPVVTKERLPAGRDATDDCKENAKWGTNMRACSTTSLYTAAGTWVPT